MSTELKIEIEDHDFQEFFLLFGRDTRLLAGQHT